MEEVYKNCFCNIALSLATTPDKGLSWDRISTLEEPFTVKFSTLTGEAYFEIVQDLQNTIRKYSPLYRRGWVLQEPYLSPRTIHFSRFPAFECRRAFVREPHRKAGILGGLRDLLSPAGADKLMGNAGPLPPSIWQTVVYYYSRCELTKPTDKIMAFRELAKILSSRETGPYYGGIWMKWWLQGLLWQVSQYPLSDELEAERWGHEYIGESIKLWQTS
jgi:hypothetical protein